MGQLFFINESFELSNTAEANRDIVFINFCEAMNEAIKSKDILFATEEIHTKNYSYGTLFYDFLYKSWPEIVLNQNLQGVSQTAHNLYHSVIYSIPNLVQLIASRAEFEQLYAGSHIGNSGFEIGQKPSPYIYSYATWQVWKQQWMSQNQNDIKWNPKADTFLPNKSFSDTILMEEVKKHNKESELKKYKGNWALTFYEEVMKKKGPLTEAYTIEIGRKVAEANYYTYQDQLSDDERNAAKGSLRNIFRLLGPNQEFQYLSLDHKHGMFEYHDHNGVHLGENKFDGSYNSEAQANHNFKTL